MCSARTHPSCSFRVRSTCNVLVWPVRTPPFSSLRPRRTNAQHVSEITSYLRPSCICPYLRAGCPPIVLGSGYLRCSPSSASLFPSVVPWTAIFGTKELQTPTLRDSGSPWVRQAWAQKSTAAITPGTAVDRLTLMSSPGNADKLAARAESHVRGWVRRQGKFLKNLVAGWTCLVQGELPTLQWLCSGG